MTNNPRLSLFLAALLAFLWTFFLYEPKVTIDSFDKRAITYSGSKIALVKLRRGTSQKIVIDSNIGELFLYHYEDDFFPANTSLEDAVALINKSSNATIWLENNTNFIRGIESAMFSIPPEKGLRHDREERLLYLVVSIGLITYTLSLYLFYVLKKQISWKLKLIKPAPSVKKFKLKNRINS